MKHRQTDPQALSFLRSNTTGMRLLGILMAVTMFFLLFSLLDTDATVSERENRKLAARPDFSFSRLVGGEYIPELETYYSDTFPQRDFFLTIDSGVSKVFSRMSFGKDDVVVVQNKDKDDFGGQSLHEVTSAEESAEEG
ncbi:MAG: hypothetical protein J5847_05495 [Clostridia bacterium]|nr:hypothetical protein [Clostridia bacterium]MBR5753150.1 hypothetical protein [Clostridia bacterium]